MKKLIIINNNKLSYQFIWQRHVTQTRRNGFLPSFLRLRQFSTFANIITRSYSYSLAQGLHFEDIEQRYRGGHSIGSSRKGYTPCAALLRLFYCLNGKAIADSTQELGVFRMNV